MKKYLIIKIYKSIGDNFVLFKQETLETTQYLQSHVFMLSIQPCNMNKTIMFFFSIKEPRHNLESIFSTLTSRMCKAGIFMLYQSLKVKYKYQAT